MKKEYQKKVQKTIGIPRGLIYYHYPKLFQVYFEKLGANIILSKRSTKSMLLNALKFSSDEECFSGKIFLGHVIDLIGKVDFIFLPKYHGMHKYKVSCPKFIGLPDVIRAIFDDLPKIISPYHSRTKKRHRKLHFLIEAFRVGFVFTKNPLKILRAIRSGIKAHKKHEDEIRWSNIQLQKWEDNKDPSNNLETVKIVLLGHSYVLEDPILSFDVKERLQSMGVEVITSEEVPNNLIENQLEKLHSVLYFEEECRIVGSALYFLDSETVDGILQLIPFPCGPTAVSSEIIMRHAKRNDNIPLIQLMIDDNTGEAGFVTRLEAFVMTMKRKKLLQYRERKQSMVDIKETISKTHEISIDENSIIKEEG
jgi:predicted nucleotide-binding protein (sugar kinase/HSP70/actin superfamily)